MNMYTVKLVSFETFKNFLFNLGFKLFIYK